MYETTLFDSLPAIKGKRSAERRIVQPRPRQVCETRLCAAACRAARRLSALTPAALATGCYPDGSAPEPGFPRRPLTGVSPASPTKRTDMPRLSTLRADRSLCRSTGDPKPPGSGWQNPRAGTAPRIRCLGMPSGTAPCTKRGDYAITETGTRCQGKSDGARSAIMRDLT